MPIKRRYDSELIPLLGQAALEVGAMARNRDNLRQRRQLALQERGQDIGAILAGQRLQADVYNSDQNRRFQYGLGMFETAARQRTQEAEQRALEERQRREMEFRAGQNALDRQADTERAVKLQEEQQKRQIQIEQEKSRLQQRDWETKRQIELDQINADLAKLDQRTDLPQHVKDQFRYNLEGRKVGIEQKYLDNLPPPPDLQQEFDNSSLEVDWGDGRKSRVIRQPDGKWLHVMPPKQEDVSEKRRTYFEGRFNHYRGKDADGLPTSVEEAMRKAKEDADALFGTEIDTARKPPTSSAFGGPLSAPPEDPIPPVPAAEAMPEVSSETPVEPSDEITPPIDETPPPAAAVADSLPPTEASPAPPTAAFPAPEERQAELDAEMQQVATEVLPGWRYRSDNWQRFGPTMREHATTVAMGVAQRIGDESLGKAAAAVQDFERQFPDESQAPPDLRHRIVNYRTKLAKVTLSLMNPQVPDWERYKAEGNREALPEGVYRVKFPNGRTYAAYYRNKQMVPLAEIHDSVEGLDTSAWSHRASLAEG